MVFTFCVPSPFRAVGLLCIVALGVFFSSCGVQLDSFCDRSDLVMSEPPPFRSARGLSNFSSTETSCLFAMSTVVWGAAASQETSAIPDQKARLVCLLSWALVFVRSPMSSLMPFILTEQRASRKPHATKLPVRSAPSGVACVSTCNCNAPSRAKAHFIRFSRGLLHLIMIFVP